MGGGVLRLSVGGGRVLLVTEPFRYPEGPAPFAARTIRSSVWHYTSAEGLLGILNSHEIWASSPKALNDLEEITFGVQKLREAFDKFLTTNLLTLESTRRIENIISVEFLTQQIDSIFIVSASMEADSLNQWQHYSNRDGFAIEIDTAVPLGLISADGLTVFGRRREDHFFPGWYDVVYQVEEQDQIISQILAYVTRMTLDPSFADDVLLNLVARMIIMPQMMRIKHQGFRDEREVRFISGSAPEIPVKYRVSNGRVVPYINMVRHRENLEVNTNNLDFIRGILCSPTTTESDVQLVRDMLSAYGLENTNISRSTIPFRK